MRYTPEQIAAGYLQTGVWPIRGHAYRKIAGVVRACGIGMMGMLERQTSDAEKLVDHRLGLLMRRADDDIEVPTRVFTAILIGRGVFADEDEAEGFHNGFDTPYTIGYDPSEEGGGDPSGSFSRGYVAGYKTMALLVKQGMLHSY